MREPNEFQLKAREMTNRHRDGFGIGEAQRASCGKKARHSRAFRLFEFCSTVHFASCAIRARPDATPSGSRRCLVNDVASAQRASAPARRAHRLQRGLAVAAAIASSTVRIEPRIWVRRDLLTAVRRAILRVAFFAEDVLAMFSQILQRPPSGGPG